MKKQYDAKIRREDRAFSAGQAAANRRSGQLATVEVIENGQKVPKAVWIFPPTGNETHGVISDMDGNDISNSVTTSKTYKPTATDLIKAGDIKTAEIGRKATAKQIFDVIKNNGLLTTDVIERVAKVNNVDADAETMAIGKYAIGQNFGFDVERFILDAHATTPAVNGKGWLDQTVEAQKDGQVIAPELKGLLNDYYMYRNAEKQLRDKKVYQSGDKVQSDTTRPKIF